jgi:hypothetical protein
MTYGALLLVSGLSRVPFIRGAGLGLDPDGWRLYETGKILAESGTYTPSRRPGYPAVELVSFLLYGMPWWAFAVATVAVTALGVVAVAALARELEVRAWPLVGLGTAFTSIVFKNSTAFMDYNWAMAALFGGLLFLAKRKAVPAGMLLGLAVACRPGIVFAGSVVLVVLLLDRTWWSRRLLVLVASAVGVAVAFFAVPLATWGPALISAVPVPLVLSRVAVQITVEIWGLYGCYALGIAVVVAVVRVVRTRGGVVVGRGVWVLALLAGVVVQLLGFLLLPDDAAYLIPVVPMVWLLAGITLRRLELAALSAAIAVAALVPASMGSSVVQNAEARRAVMASLNALTARVRAMPSGSVVVVGAHYAQVVAMLGVPLEPSLEPTSHVQHVELSGGQVITYNPLP